MVLGRSTMVLGRSTMVNHLSSVIGLIAYPQEQGWISQTSLISNFDHDDNRQQTTDIQTTTTARPHVEASLWDGLITYHENKTNFFQTQVCPPFTRRPLLICPMKVDSQCSVPADLSAIRAALSNCLEPNKNVATFAKYPLNPRSLFLKHT